MLHTSAPTHTTEHLLTRQSTYSHDSAPTHTALVGKAALRDCGFWELSHPSYSPDLTPYDLHPFPNLKGHIRGKHFEDDNELKIAREEWLLGEDKTLDLSGIEKLLRHYNTCIAVRGAMLKIKFCFTVISLDKSGSEHVITPVIFNCGYTSHLNLIAYAE